MKTETDKLIEPIDARFEQQVISATSELIQRAGEIFGQQFPKIPVLFDLKGRAAGMYKVQRQQRLIRYNPYIFAKYFSDNLNTTVPHEVAHYVTDLMYGLRHIKPHGPEWKQVMLSLGADPVATGSYDLTGIPLRRQHRHDYRCACSTHQISTIRHNKIRNGKASYYCRYCKSTLESVDH